MASPPCSRAAPSQRASGRQNKRAGPKTSVSRGRASVGARTSSSRPPPARRRVKAKNAQHRCSAAASSRRRAGQRGGQLKSQATLDPFAAVRAGQQAPPLIQALGLARTVQGAGDRQTPDRLRVHASHASGRHPPGRGPVRGGSASAFRTYCGLESLRFLRKRQVPPAACPVTRMTAEPGCPAARDRPAPHRTAHRRPRSARPAPAAHRRPRVRCGLTSHAGAPGAAVTPESPSRAAPGAPVPAPRLTGSGFGRIH